MPKLSQRIQPNQLLPMLLEIKLCSFLKYTIISQCNPKNKIHTLLINLVTRILLIIMSNILVFFMLFKIKFLHVKKEIIN